MKYIKYSTEFTIKHIELLYILNDIANCIMIKLTRVAFCKDKEIVGIESKMNA